MGSVNYSYGIGELSLVQRQGIITLLLEENKSRQNLTNYRPICLLNLNTVYKIASASIANRLKTALDKHLIKISLVLFQRDTPRAIHDEYMI